MATTRKKTYWIIGVIFACIVIAHYTGFLVPVETLFRESFLPVFRSARSVSVEVGDSYHFYRDRASFLEAYREAVRKAEDGEVLKAKVGLYEEENAELKRQLEYKNTHSMPSIAAQVVGKEVAGLEQTLIIDKGTRDGVVIDSPVAVGQGILVGKISKVDETTSVVRLINDKLSRVGATILNRDRSLGVVESGYGLTLQMNLIPRDEPVVVGDQIVTSGLEVTIPRGLLIGTVASVENEPFKPFQTAVITPATRLEKVTYVSVLLSK